jgi:hypothetical protein
MLCPYRMGTRSKCCMLYAAYCGREGLYVGGLGERRITRTANRDPAELLRESSLLEGEVSTAQMGDALAVPVAQS